jgi:hypothetical protein
LQIKLARCLLLIQIAADRSYGKVNHDNAEKENQTDDEKYPCDSE